MNILSRSSHHQITAFKLNFGASLVSKKIVCLITTTYVYIDFFSNLLLYLETLYGVDGKLLRDIIIFMLEVARVLE